MINLSLDDILFLLKTKNKRLTLQNKEHLKQLLTNKFFSKSTSNSQKIEIKTEQSPELQVQWLH